MNRNYHGYSVSSLLQQISYFKNDVILTYDVILAQNDVILTQNGPISHKMIDFDVFTPLMTFMVNYFNINVVELMFGRF